jgi:hypothetical protein
MTATLSPGHPQHIADLFASGDVKWERGWGDRDKHTCLHGALLRPCAEPGDEIMWSTLISYRGYGTRWTDKQTKAAPVIGALRKMADPDDAEMVAAFGPDWRAARWVCRTWAQATDEQRRDARDAWDARDARAAWVARDAWDARDARAARDAWAAWAAWDARAAWDAWDAWDAWVARDARDTRDTRDAWAAWDARDARAARAAFLAVVTRHLIGQPGSPEGWTQDAYARLVAPFESVFGEIPLS